MADTFFVSWALWQEMTFVLAAAIVLVFIAGLVKLWRGNRIMAKQELVDEEKRARVSELRKTGLPAKRRTEIPFGVRALQNGVEVDGIFISRPTTSGTTASEIKKGMSTTTTIVALGDAPSKKQPDTESTKSKQAPRRTNSSLSIMERAPGADSAETRSNLSIPALQQFDEPPPRSERRRPSALNEEALRQLEGQLPQTAPQLPTFVPPSGLSTPESSTGPRPYQQTERRPGSSGSGSSHVSSLSIGQRQYPNTYRGVDRTARYASVPQMATEHCNCCTCQNRPALNRAASSQDRLRYAMVDGNNLASPQPTFGPGESYVNRASRRVNEGFEVLPAGTLSHPSSRSGRHHSNGV